MGVDVFACKYPPPQMICTNVFSEFYEGKCQQKYFSTELKPEQFVAFSPDTQVIEPECKLALSGNRFLADQREAQDCGWFLQPGFPSY